MSYLVLARKYRPRSFTELVGQTHVVQALTNALEQQRLHHAYLFTGTRGVGKTTVSRILAKSLNCVGADGQGGITATPCGVCEACRDIDAGRYVDYVELDAASNRGVDEITQLLDQSVYKPVVGRFKVYMIDEVHMLSTTAFNAMLKTLEEPPEYLKFVLATTDPQKVPVTVLSRCLQFNLRPMALETVHEHLERVLAAEQITADAASLRLIARAARGSMRDALSLTDQAIAFGGGKLEVATVREMLGAVDRSQAVRIVEAIAAADGARLIAQIDELRSAGLSANGTLEELIALAQQMAVLQAVPAAHDAADPDSAETLRLAGLLPADETQLLYSVALHGRHELALSPDEYSGLTMVLLRLLAFRPGGDAPAVTAPSGAGSAAARAAGPARATAAIVPSALAPRAASGSPTAAATTPRAASPAPVPVAPRAVPTATPAPSPRPAPRAAPAAPSAAPTDDAPPWEDVPPVDADGMPITLVAGATAARAAPTGDAAARTDDMPAAASVTLEPPRRDPCTDRWCDWVQRLVAEGRISALVRELAWQAQCIAIDDSVAPPRWVLRTDRETLRQGQVRERLEAALCESHGGPVRLELESGTVEDSAARRDAHARAVAQAEAEALIRDDPLVVSLLQEFKTARIVPGSVRPV